jgi:outer membrane immunogenic protein
MRCFALALLASTALTGTAFGADIARRAPVASQPVAYGVNWTGFYVGAHIGGAWTEGGDNFWDPVTAAWWNTDDSSGFIGGGQIGFNYQIGQWVLGVEGDISWTDLGNDNRDLANYYSRSTDWFATVTGRLGYAWDNWLLYVKGGGAWADGNDYYWNRPLWQGDGSRSGWAVGAGLEWAWTPNWSVKLEYNYLDFGSDHDAWFNTWDHDYQIHAVKVGINYRFGGPAAVGPVSTRY